MDLATKKCIPCEAGTPPMAKEQAEKMLGDFNSYSSSDPPAGGESRSSRQARTVNRWELTEEDGKLKIRKRFKFDSYLAGVDFVDKVAQIAEGEGHHPDIFLGWRRVTVNLMTHAIGGLSQNDFIMAAKIDNL